MQDIVNREVIQRRVFAIEQERDFLLQILSAHDHLRSESKPAAPAPNPAQKRGRPKGIRKAEVPVVIPAPEIPLTLGADGILRGDLPAPPKRRGRPKGSKNKPKSNGIVVTGEVS